MKNVLVLGRTGMLGYMVYKVLSRSKELKVEGTQRRDKLSPYYLEVSDPKRSIEAFFKSATAFDYVINCIGAVKIAPLSADSVQRAIIVNSLFPYELGKLLEKYHFKVLHISTDGVFSGKSDTPYYEDSPHDCTDFYGKTKSLGEVINPRILNLRCSIVGTELDTNKGLLGWFLSQPSGSVIYGYTNHVWNGVTTLQYALLCQRVILEDLFDELREQSHVFHFSPNIALSKFELLTIFNDLLKKGVVVLPTQSPDSPVCRMLETKYPAFRGIVGDKISFRSAMVELLSCQVV